MNLYSLSLGIGATLGLILTALRAPRGLAVQRTAWAAFTLLVALIAARAAFVAFHANIYQDNLLRALSLSDGGLSWPGALLGGLLMVLLARFRWKTTLGDTADALIVPLLIPVAAAAWLGCLPAGCAYGMFAPEGSWWGINAPDEFGAPGLRFPLQPLAAIVIAGCGLYLERKADNFPRPGQHASLAMLATAAAMVVFSILRSDSRPGWQGLTLDMWAAFAFLLLAWLAVAAAFVPRGVREL